LAEASGRHRRTIRRMLDAGAFGSEGTRQDDDGRWLVAVDAALAAGLALHRPAPLPARSDDPLSAVPSSPSPIETQLREQLALAERRALVAEAETRGLRDALEGLREAVTAMARALPPGGAPLDQATPVTGGQAEKPRSRRWRRRRAHVAVS
jgi:hypothetical protein